MRKAFTLVELLIALTLLSTLCLAAFPFIGTARRSWQKAAAANDRRQVGNIVLARLVNEIRAGSAIIAGSGSAEALVEIDGETIGYAFVNGKVRRKKGSAAGYLTNEKEVASLSFSYPADRQLSIELDDLRSLVVLRN